MDLWYTERHNGVGITLQVTDTLFHGVSEFQTVDVVETAVFGRMLLLDGLVMTTEKDEFIYHELISHVPLLALPTPPKRVLVVGGGDGGTIREVLRHEAVETAVLCEIDGMVIDASRAHLPTISGGLDDPRVEIVIADGVAYLEQIAAAGPAHAFDAIIIDSTDPISIGEGLFTVDFYRNVARALTPDGVMVCQSESPLVDMELFLAMQAKLGQVFSVVRPFVAPIYTYPGGYWSWTYCSQNAAPLEFVDWTQSAALAQKTRYYNTAVHRAVFALPNYVQQAVDAQLAARSVPQ